MSWKDEAGANHKAVFGVMVAASCAALGQAIHVTLSGRELCLGDGCNVVAALTRVSPFAFNLAGGLLFVAVAVVAWLARSGARPGLSLLLRALLVGALASEGVLVGYQHEVAGAFCLYCLGLFAAILTASLLHGLRTALSACGAFTATIIAFSALVYVPTRGTLNDGTFAARECAERPELYLIFSERCPHCQRVVEALRECDRCTVRFNPISEVPDSLLEELPHEARYDPRINRAAARIMGFNTIPVLMAREPAGLRLVTGERAILDYVERTCSLAAPATAEAGRDDQPWTAPETGDDPEGSCGLADAGCEL